MTAAAASVAYPCPQLSGCRCQPTSTSPTPFGRGLSSSGPAGTPPSPPTAPPPQPAARAPVPPPARPAPDPAVPGEAGGPPRRQLRRRPLRGAADPAGDLLPAVE